MESFLFGLLSAAILAVCGLILRQVKRLGGEFNSLKDSQRCQIKNTIVHSYELAKCKGYITPIELETVSRLYDSYKELGGNSYVSTIINRLNSDIEIKGTDVPEHEV